MKKMILMAAVAVMALPVLAQTTQKTDAKMEQKTTMGKDGDMHKTTKTTKTKVSGDAADKTTTTTTEKKDVTVHHKAHKGKKEMVVTEKKATTTESKEVKK